MERQQSQSLIRLDGELTVTSAAELKNLLIEGLSSGQALRLDLENVADVDITILQLLWAVGREALRTGAVAVVHLSECAGAAARETGFEGFPGLTVEE
jgi:ABC-type transporter Mla MlaB component